MQLCLGNGGEDGIGESGTTCGEKREGNSKRIQNIELLRVHHRLRQGLAGERAIWIGLAGAFVGAPDECDFSVCSHGNLRHQPGVEAEEYMSQKSVQSPLAVTDDGRIRGR